MSDQSTPLFDMLIRVPARNVGPIIELVGTDGKVLEVKPTSEPPSSRRRARHYGNGHGRRGVPATATAAGEKLPRNAMRGLDLLLDIMAGGHEWTYDKLKAAFVQAGKAHNSMSPILSKRIADGSVVRVRDGVYRIAPK
jgi:hypothetical protein